MLQPRNARVPRWHWRVYGSRATRLRQLLREPHRRELPLLHDRRPSGREPRLLPIRILAVHVHRADAVDLWRHRRDRHGGQRWLLCNVQAAVQWNPYAELWWGVRLRIRIWQYLSPDGGGVTQARSSEASSSSAACGSSEAPHPMRDSESRRGAPGRKGVRSCFSRHAGTGAGPNTYEDPRCQETDYH